MNLARLLMLRLMFRSTLILILLVLAGCTVTKRVHRPGYHIEWRKTKSAVGKNEISQRMNQHMDSVHPDLTEHVGRTPKEGLRTDSKLTDDEININRTEENSVQEITIKEPDSPEKTVRNEDPTTAKKNYRKTKKLKLKWPPNARSEIQKTKPVKVRLNEERNESLAYNLQIAGIIVLSTGVLLLLGSILSYFGFFLIVDLFYALVFSGNGIIASIFGFLLFLVIAIALLALYAVVRYILGGYILGFIMSAACIISGGVLLIVANFVI